MEGKNVWIVTREKVVGYLLNEAHPAGRGKAAFFEAFGYTQDDWEALADGLSESARKGEVTHRMATPFGLKIVTLGELKSPSGEQIVVRTVWMEIPESRGWRLVTAYPDRRKRT